MNFIKCDKVTKRIVGTHSGPSAPVDAVHDFIEVTEADVADANLKMIQAVNEFRDLTYDGGIILGAAPANVVRLDIEGPTVLKAGDSAKLILERVGSGTLTLNLNGQQFQLKNATPRIELTLTAS